MQIENVNDPVKRFDRCCMCRQSFEVNHPAWADDHYCDICSERLAEEMEQFYREHPEG